MLEVLGVSGDEERVYRVLVAGHRSGPQEIAARLGMSVSDVEPLLTALLDKRLVSRTRADQFVPAPPDVALGPLLVDGQAELERARATVGQLAEQYRTNVRRRDSAQLVEVLTGAEAIRQQALSLQRDAREEMLWFCRQEPIALTAADNDEEFRALARGVRFKVIYEASLLDGPGAWVGLEEGMRMGEKARVLPSLPVRLAIADRSVALCPLGEEATGEPTAALVRGTSLLVALISLFESHWERATPIHIDEAADSDLSAEDRQLLSMLIGGVSDKAIAKQMSVSSRTVQRRVQDLMTRSGARGRMQLAWQACRLGWLDNATGSAPPQQGGKDPAAASATA
ncbi:LuxR C-terminal-related transcriptional regulator [Streptomyces sp. NPDC052107]|uniref:LuxR C-terminal-related transcriptional regulator n=1 Tax=Streptomyces sp. NPDC052107 TaxID=3155632 RepID=UPI00341EA2DD